MIASTQTNHPLVGGKPGAKALSPVEFATAKLKSAGLRITQPRLAILAALSKQPQPVSIEQLHLDLGSGACDLVTVYRCMAAFEEIGLVRRAFFHNGTALYEINLGQPTRYHVACKETNRVEELDAATSAELNRALREIEDKLSARGFTDVGHIVEFFGVAPAARSGRVAGPAPAVPAPAR
ncbi:MAG: transcriptional repressor [Opitutus sp.]|nr:transcriptional repressor [Opitutus sp.]